MTSILNIRNVSKSYGALQAVNGISLDAPSGEITAVIGPNGAGKTSLFNCVTGLIRPDTSDTEFVTEGMPAARLKDLGPEQISKIGIARTFQQVRLFDSLSVLDNVRLAMVPGSGFGWGAVLLDRLRPGQPRHNAMREKAAAIVERLGLGQHMNELAGNLDHGNRRRLEIARGLAAEPKALLLDEPAAGMNHSETRQLMDLLVQLRAEKLALLLIEHDMNLIMGISDSVYVMDYGKLIASGKPAEVASNPAVIEAYLGRPLERHA